jgi:hypothetical protein
MHVRSAGDRPGNLAGIEIDDDDVAVVTDIESPAVGIRARVIPSVVARYWNPREQMMAGGSAISS